jgi:hypothetical protein
MLKFAIAAVVLVSASGALAAGSTPADIVHRHVSSGGNIDAIMADYANDAVVLQNGRAIEGKAAIRKLFENMFGGRRAGPPAAKGPGPESAAPPAGAASKMTVDKVWQEGNVGFVNWHMGPMHATEEFVTRNGKIEVQAIFMTGGPSAARQG